ncbi:hypothetical protein [Streptomyces sp. NPDC051561]|uniref:hypothetical protein n=1 Tax=Streptomyces sp. NPDC051561 TaxID=3365658 RepID=UPI0037BA393B
MSTKKPEPPPRTPDGHYVLIKGRRWRATDPDLPVDVADRLRHHLMAARREVGAALRAGDTTAERAARHRVRSAKVALGERGAPWWEQNGEERRERWQTGLAELEPPADGD